MTTLTQNKPQAQTTKQLDAIDGEFDYLIGLRPQVKDLNSDYYKGYKAAADKQGKTPF
jgi:hypothetical protein